MREQSLSLKDAKAMLFNFLTAEAIRQNRKLEVDDSNKAVFVALSQWLAKDETDGIDSEKGVGLLGSVGVGKTLAMRAVRMCLQQMRSPRIFDINVCASVFDDAEAARKRNDDGLAKYRAGNRCFDDLGEEKTVLHDYGNRIEVLCETLLARHRRFEVNGVQTHFTTNKSVAELEAIYGSRVHDRLFEMCNLISIGGASRRK